MSNVNVVKSTYEAFGRGDMQAVLAAMDPKIEWRDGSLSIIPTALFSG